MSPRRPRLSGPSLGAARSAAYRLAVMPFAFQAARSARDLGLLAALREGIPRATLSSHLGIPDTSVGTLLDACLVIELVAEDPSGVWSLTTIGAVWLTDPAISIEAEFTHAVCWHGLADLPESLRTGRPVGLSRFGPWLTIYEGLAHLPEEVRRPWFAYDHGHSDSAFGVCIAELRQAAPQRILDVGGNTGRFSLAVLAALPTTQITILDHPGQVAEARRNLDAAGFAERSTTTGIDLLDHERAFPTGQDAVWMSQFLDCFGPADIIALLRRARLALAPGGQVWVLECCPDRQSEPAAADSLRLASLYFTALANGVSRFYRGTDFVAFAEAAGLQLVSVQDGLGTAHSLFRFTPV
jgi:hypothetical protein